MEKLVLTVVTLVSVLLLTLLGGASAGTAGYNEKCDEEANVTTTTASGVTTVLTSDSCDKKLFLTCKDKRCRCSDSVYGEYTSKQVLIVTLPRSKRSPGKGSKGGKSKGVSKGTAIGGAVVAGGVGYLAGKTIAESNTNSGSYSTGQRTSSSSGNSRPKDRYTTVHSCFNRVEGECVLDPNLVKTVENTTIVDGNSTKVISQIDYRNRPECVQGKYYVHFQCLI